jgi:hypothetical protein
VGRLTDCICENKLSATMGAAKVPVVYVIRDVLDDNYEFEDNEERRIHQMALAGESFKRDNRLVYRMLKAACVKKRTSGLGSRTMITR